MDLISTPRLDLILFSLSLSLVFHLHHPFPQLYYGRRTLPCGWRPPRRSHWPQVCTSRPSALLRHPFITKESTFTSVFTSITRLLPSNLNLLSQIYIPPREARAWRVPVGFLCRLDFAHGPRVADVNFWNLHNPPERFYSSKTRQLHASHFSVAAEVSAPACRISVRSPPSSPIPIQTASKNTTQAYKKPSTATPTRTVTPS